MTTTNVTNSNALQVFRYAEIALYAILAAVLIGRTFSLTSPFTLPDALTVLLGEAFGIMACCGGSPLTTIWQSLRGRSVSVFDEVIKRSASILPFVRPADMTSRTRAGHDDERNRAA